MNFIFRYTVRFLQCLSLVAIVTYANIASAQTVRIQNGLGEFGFGWMFLSGGSCFIALPEHVAGPLPKITVSTAAPVVSDQATVLKPFWEGIDLAIAIPDQGMLHTRCVAVLNDLSPNNISRNARQIDLLRIKATGQSVQTQLHVTRRNYLTLEAETTESDASIAQGTSGAFAFVGTKPVGMAIESDGASHARFIRAEEIQMNIRRYIGEHGSAYQPAEREIQPKPSDSSGVLIESVSSNAAPTLPQFGPANLLGEGLFVANPDRPLEVLLNLRGDRLQSISRVRVEAVADDYAVPSQVIVSLSLEQEAKGFRFWSQGRMTPDGQFDTGIIAPRKATWVKLRFLGRWTTGEVALKRVLID